ncbi:hypothetical protein ACLOJK_037281 [Asimina triloba]
MDRVRHIIAIILIRADQSTGPPLEGSSPAAVKEDDAASKLRVDEKKKWGRSERAFSRSEGPLFRLASLRALTDDVFLCNCFVRVYS